MKIWPFNSAASEAPVRVAPTLGAPDVPAEPQSRPQNGVEVSKLESWTDLLAGIGEHPAGVSVSSRAAMRVSAVFACVRIIGGAIGSLPLPIYQKTSTINEKAHDHPLWDLLNYEPNPVMTSMSFREYGMHQNLLNGDWISWIKRPTRYSTRIDGIYPFPTANVRIEKLDGQLVYHFSTDEGVTISAWQDDVLHVPGVGFNGVRSLSCIQGALGFSAGMALAADETAARLFKNGMTQRGTLEYPKKVSEEQSAMIQDYVMRMQSGPENAGKPMILTEGGKFTNTTMSPADAQLMEQRKATISDIARIFGVPHHLIGETDKSTSWGSGIEQQSIGFVQYSLAPHLTRIEQEINRKLFRGTDYFVEFNVDGLLRGDSKSRAEALRQSRGGSQGPGWRSLNEVRAIENLPPVEGGDEVYNPKSEELKDAPKTDPDVSGQSETEDDDAE